MLAILSLIFLSACSSNNGSPGIKCPGATGSYTNASLGPNGTQWAYQLSGWFLNSSNAYTPYTEAGYFVVDGRGNITSGFDDFFGSTSVTGNYSIISNGTGTINLNVTNTTGTQPLVWGMTLANPGVAQNVGSFTIIEGDTFANSSGAAYQQTASLLTTSPSGTWVFRNHVLTSGSSIAGSQDSVGLISFSGTSVTLSYDYNNAGTTGLVPSVAGTFTAPTNGLGTITIGTTTSFDYYVIDANDALLYETDSNGGLGLGRAELQQTGGFTNASFSGSYAFGSRGDTTSSGADGVNTVGQITVDGAGHVSGGSLDSVRDGSPQLTQTISSSTYSQVSANGRVTVTLPASGGSFGDVLYLVSPSRAFFLVNSDSTRVEDGTMDLQSSTNFSGSDFSGQYAFVMGGSTGGPVATVGVPLDRTGTVQADGNGNLGWAEQVNSGGNGNSVCLIGTYTTGTNGRVAGSVSTLSSNLVFYLISPGAGYALQGDSGAQLSGGLVNQSAPVNVVPGAFKRGR